MAYKANSTFYKYIIFKLFGYQNQKCDAFLLSSYGKSQMFLDREAVERLEDISKLSDEKKYDYKLIDMCLRDFKMRNSFNTYK